MSLMRSVAAKASSTPPVRAAGSLLLRHLRSRTNLDNYESIAFGRLVGLFAIGQRSSIAPLRNGLRIRVRTDDHVGRVLYAMGDFQPRVSWAIRRLLDQSDTVLDIGANIGWFVCTAAPLVGSGGRIEAFEPQPKIASALRETCALNGLSQATVHEYALSDHDGEAAFQILSGNTGAGRIGETAPGEAWVSTKVQMRNAEIALEGLNLGPIRMVKMDVEGHEATILKAAESYFSKRPPDVFVFESNIGEDQPFYQRETVSILQRMGYRFFQFLPSPTEVRIGEVPLSGEGVHFSNDFIALHDGPRFREDVRRLNACETHSPVVVSL